MKVLFILVLVIAAAGAGLYFSGALHMEDPAEQAAKLKAAAGPGNTWETVVAVHPPTKFYSIDFSNISGHGPEQKFDHDAFADMIKNDKGSEGYYLIYNISNDYAFLVNIDNKGNTRGTQDLVTMKSLLQPNGAGLQPH